ncbi:MAG: glutamine synthetase family protein [Pseudomonadota bacterium]
MAGNLDLDTLRQEVSEGTIDTVLVCMVDMQGRLIGKRVTGHFFLEQVVEEMHACDYLLAVDMDMEPVPGYQAASWDLGYGDFAIKPDMATLRRIPWLEGTALVLGDVTDHHGTDLPHSPRAILKRQIKRAADLGLTAFMASELEFFVFNEPYDAARDKRYRELKTAGWYIEDYHIFQTTKEESLIRAIRNGMDGAAIPVEFSKGEWGPGQAELNLRYAEALEMADRHAIYKNGVKEIAFLQGKAVTFMAKWDNALAGSSCHIHTSLRQTAGGSAFTDATGEPSTMFGHFLAGQVALARDLTFFLAPYINSYKRFQEDSFAPTKAIWSRDNRTAGFRVVGSGPSLRVECRIPGADANPYLAYAALLAAGLHGIEQQLLAPDAFSGNAYVADDIAEVPKTLREALDCLDRSTPLRAALGDEVVDHYLHCGRWEQREYDRRVTDHELIHGFERA